MTSWREKASPQAQADLDQLLNAALGFAQQQLDQHQEFYPYAVVIDAAGQQRMVAAEASTDHPASADLVADLIDALTAQRAQLRGAAIVTDVRLPEPDSDAVRVTLEHVEGVALSVFLPYRHRRFGRGTEYGDLHAGGAMPFVWE